MNIANDLRDSMSQCTQSKEHDVIPINTKFMLLQNKGCLRNRSFCDFIIRSEVRDALEDLENPYSTSSMRL